MRASLGEPEVSSVAAGDMYRWTLVRGPYEVKLYVTMDSPEHPNLAHIMISDGPGYQPKPVVSFIVYTLAEIDQLVDRILRQWRTSAR